jgi:hypothetical protein
MSNKTKKNKTIKQITNKKNKTIKQITNKTGKGLQEMDKYTIIPNTTPNAINEISQQIRLEIESKNKNESDTPDSFIIKSYSPSVNQELVSLKSLTRETINDCNTEAAFLLQEPLKIGITETEPIKGKSEKICYLYYEPKAKQFLLNNLMANKHVNPDKIITPIQAESNCWFNTMFVSLFISDKGRKFFHFFRQLMIEGQQINGKPVPDKLKNGFALLNYAIEACLTGNKNAYTIDTNAIIKELYRTIPNEYKKQLPYFTATKEAGNPIRYYGSLIYYLNNKSLDLLFVSDVNNNWKKMITEKMKQKQMDSPHLIILEFFDDKSNKVVNKKSQFTIDDKKYVLDSCIIRNTKRHHFSSLLTCDKTEMAYDGMSFHRLVKMEWKKNINKNHVWRFEGSNDGYGKQLEWNFLNGYQMLIYYRVK